MKKESMNPDERLANTIINYVKSNPKLYQKYYSYNKLRKYDLDKLLPIIVDILKLGKILIF